jgi:hypothetical protein
VSTSEGTTAGRRGKGRAAKTGGAAGSLTDAVVSGGHIDSGGGGSGAGGGGVSGSTEEGGMSVTLESLVAACGIKPLRIDSRQEGTFGAVFPLALHDKIKTALFSALTGANNVTLVPIPPATLQALTTTKANNSKFSPDATGYSLGELGGREWDKIAERIPAGLRKSLLPYQVEGVQFVVSRKGRALVTFSKVAVLFILYELTTALTFRAFVPGF